MNKKSLKNNNNLTVFEPKAPLRGSYCTDAIPLSQKQVFKVGFKGQSHMFGLSIYSTPK